MARLPRLVRLGVWYYITAPGVERRLIFRDDSDRAHFLELLGELSERFRVRLLAYVLMENHYHLLLELGEPNLSQAIQWLNANYSAWFNVRHGRARNLFRGRFKSILVDPDSRGYKLSAYMHLNPVRTGRRDLSKTARQRDQLTHLRGYVWSSYRAFAGYVAGPGWLDTGLVLDKGGGPKSRQRQQYRHHVEAQVKYGRIDNPWEELRDRIFLGGNEFIKRVKARAQRKSKAGSSPAWAPERIPVDAIIRAVEKVKKEPWTDFKNRHADGGLALVVTLAQRHSGLTQAQLARKIGIPLTSNISMISKRYRQRLGQDRAENIRAQRVAKLLNASI